MICYLGFGFYSIYPFYCFLEMTFIYIFYRFLYLYLGKRIAAHNCSSGTQVRPKAHLLKMHCSRAVLVPRLAVCTEDMWILNL